MWYFNPPEPTGQRARPGRKFNDPGSGAWSLPPAYLMECQFGPSDLLWGVHLFPEAEGRHLLRRRRKVTPESNHPTGAVDFIENKTPDLFTTMWTARRKERPPQRPDDPVEHWLPGQYSRWHLAFDFDFPQFFFGGNDDQREALRDAVADGLFFLEVYGYTPNPDVLDHGLVHTPPINSWVLWYGPDAEVVSRESFGLPFVYYIIEGGTFQRAMFNPLQPIRLHRRFMGLELYFPIDFPEFIDIQPFWP